MLCRVYIRKLKTFNYFYIDNIMNKERDNEIYCPECSKVIEHKAAFCPNCGFELKKLETINKTPTVKVKPEIKPKKKWAKIIMVGAVIFVVVLVVLSQSFVVVQAGNVRVLTHYGRTVGVTFQPGFHIKTPFIQNTVNYSTRQLTYETSGFSENNNAMYPGFPVKTTSSDGQQIQLIFTIKFVIDDKQAEWILNNIGTMDDLLEKVVKTEARSLSRNIPKKYTAEQLNSEQVFNDVQDEIGSTLEFIFKENGIIMDEFLLGKIDFTE